MSKDDQKTTTTSLSGVLRWWTVIRLIIDSSIQTTLQCPAPCTRCYAHSVVIGTSAKAAVSPRRAWGDGHRSVSRAYTRSLATGVHTNLETVPPPRCLGHLKRAFIKRVQCQQRGLGTNGPAPPSRIDIYDFYFPIDPYPAPAYPCYQGLQYELRICLESPRTRCSALVLVNSCLLPVCV